MGIRFKFIIIVTMWALGLTRANAQQKAVSPTVNNTPLAVTPARLKAAEEMLIASGADVLFQKEIESGIEQYSKQVPEDKRVKFNEVMKRFIGMYCSWNVMKDELCMMYAHEFTEPELKQLTTFYRTPLGLKLTQKQPELFRAAALMEQRAVTDHQDQLKLMLTDAFK